MNRARPPPVTIPAEFLNRQISLRGRGAQRHPADRVAKVRPAQAKKSPV